MYVTRSWIRDGQLRWAPFGWDFGCPIGSLSGSKGEFVIPDPQLKANGTAQLSATEVSTHDQGVCEFSP